MGLYDWLLLSTNYDPIGQRATTFVDYACHCRKVMAGPIYGDGSYLTKNSCEETRGGILDVRFMN
jgi:hypothetical protein